MQLRVIDLDGSAAVQEPLHRRIDAGAATRIDATDLGSALRIVASRRALSLLHERLRAKPMREGEASVTFYGSGDFHHLTAGLLAQTGRPLTVVHFDNHPDWVRFPATVNCGAWVNRALELDHVKRVVTIGPCSSDLVRPEWQFPNLEAVSDGRIELYPWRHAPSRVWRRYRDGRGHKQRAGALHWRNLADENWSDFLDELIRNLPTRRIWLTIDKDVLGPADAATNWDQGELPLENLLLAIERLAEQCEIVGIDICGDYSEPRFADPFRATLAYFDHPPRREVTAAELAVNARVNGVLLDCFDRVLS